MEFLRHKSMAMTLRYAHIKDEKRRATLGVNRDGSPGLDLFDAKGSVLWQAPR